jgi:tRNA A37 N6-isopentenylltransferase MiaA
LAQVLLGPTPFSASQRHTMLESAVSQMKLDTLHYAKRQWTWWRGQKNTIWLNGFGFEEGVIAEGRRVVEQKRQEYGNRRNGF